LLGEAHFAADLKSRWRTSAILVTVIVVMNRCAFADALDRAVSEQRNQYVVRGCYESIRSPSVENKIVAPMSPMTAPPVLNNNI
jgi:hypothetical protein